MLINKFTLLSPLNILFHSLFSLDCNQTCSRSNHSRPMQWCHKIHSSWYNQSSYLGYRHVGTEREFLGQFVARGEPIKTRSDFRCIWCYGRFCVHRRGSERAWKISDSRETWEKMLSTGFDLFQNVQCKKLSNIIIQNNFFPYQYFLIKLAQCSEK